MQGIVATHGALQLGKLADHVGHQVGLGELRRLRGSRGECGVARRGAQLFADGMRDAHHALHPFALGAELVVIDHLGQRLDPRGQRLLTILVVEELGIGQPRTHDALVAADDGAGVIGLDVADHKEAVGETAGCVEQRKVFLIGLHREDEAFLRHVEELSFELAHEHLRSLHQSRDFVEQGVVIDRLRTCADGRRCLRQLARDLGAPRVEAGDDSALVVQLLRVAVRIAQHDGVHGRLETMAMGIATCLEPEYIDRHDGVAMQRNQPVRRTHEAHTGPAGHRAAGFELVAHHLGDRHLGDSFAQRVLQSVGECRALCGAFIEKSFCFSVHRSSQPRHGGCIGAQCRQPFEQRGTGVAGGVERHGHGHELLRDRTVAGLREHVREVGGQAPG